MEPPGKDLYSGAAAKAIRTSSGHEPGGYLWANLQARNALQKTIENIEAALAQYQVTEKNAELGLKA
ncbi:hypothetical protein GCM10022243_15470 [Saccharothrix violaceirubra]|uniref:Uncharacterized protein n=1 Tax=Saccharothrix violaceirubra TaxID=413306 RepID=A0A7W7T6E4_9PSEU|nr:hypothetical protein [Saccharothrix violaceirubra]MBB4967423.1 hypothetical protein [Saccharothrix violaceirubra]